MIIKLQCSRTMTLVGVTLIALTLSSWTVNGDFSERPRNTLALSEERTILRCCSHKRNANFKWIKYRHSLPEKICERGRCPKDNNYQIDGRTQGCNDLVVVSASANDAALYECEIDEGSSAAAHLVVYSCGTNISNSRDIVEGDRVAIRCEIMWKDKPQFQAYWKDEKGNVLNSSNFTEQQDAYVSTLMVSTRRPELLGFSWVFQFLALPVTDNKIDTSAPVANWTLERMNVSYPVGSVRTSCRDDACERKVGDLITCFADGFPLPDYLWLDEDDKQVSRNPELIVRSGDTQKYKCVAANTIRGRSHSASVSVKVFIREEKLGSSPAPVNYYIAVIVTLVLVFIIVSFGRRFLKDKAKLKILFRSKRRGDTKHGTQETRELTQSIQPLPSDNEGTVDNNASNDDGDGDDDDDDDDDDGDEDGGNEDSGDEDDEDQNDDEGEKQTILPKSKGEHEDDGSLKKSEEIAEDD